MRKISAISLMLIVMFFVSWQAGSQVPDGTKKPGVLSVTETSVSFGYHKSIIDGGSQAQYLKLIPQSDLLTRDFSHLTRYKFDHRFVINHYNPAVFSASFGLRFADRDRKSFKKVPMLRLGLSYYTGNLITNIYSEEILCQIDSMYDPGTGLYNFTDSLHMSNFYVAQVTDQMRIDAAVLFGTNSSKVLSCYSGLGLSAGIPVMAYSSVHYYESYQYVSRTSGGHQTFLPGETLESVEETFRRSSFFVLMPYVPVGINVRLSRKVSLLNQISLFYEGRIGMDMIILKGGDDLSKIRRQHTIGLKVRW
jgi:hypothetical protein